VTKRLRVKANIGKSRGAAGRFHASHTAAAQRSAKAITDEILRIFDQFEEASEEIMLEALEPTMALADSYCPVDTGAMLASGYLEVTTFRGKPRVEIGYGKGGVPDYTAYVHENMEMSHDPPTRAKWLQAAVMEDLGGIYSRLGAGYKRFMGA
jgi:hypothetical protein